MARAGVTLGGVSIPNKTSAEITVYEDVGGTGSGDKTDPNDTPYNNSDTITLEDGKTSYTTDDVFDMGGGNDIWFEIVLDNTDVGKTAEINTPIQVE